MIYLDSSAALACVFAEARRPTQDFWDRPMTSSQLLTYEVANRLNA